MDAVIDIGSNSVRLALDRGESVNPKLINTTCLADGLAKTGRLSNEAMQRTLAAIVEFASKAREERADNIYIFATEAMRSATNGGEFRSAVEKAVSLPVRVISGDAEARLGLLGAISPDTHDEITAIDIGGASVEVVRGDEKKLTYARSLPLGVVRLRNIAGDRREDIEKYVSKHITDFGFVSGYEGVAIGGTATSLAAMDLRQTRYDASAVHGHVLSMRAIDNLLDESFSSDDRRKDFPVLSEKRARVIGHGAIMLRALVEYLGLEDGVTVSEHDNVEGFLYCVRNGIKIE